MAPRIAIVQGHPDPIGSHFCHALADAYAEGAAAAGHQVDRIDVAAMDIPFAQSRADLEGPPPEPIARAQAVLTHATHIVLVFPIWNGGMPARLVAFLEHTFRKAFVFPDSPAGARLGFAAYFTQRKALTGKSARVVVTMQMPAWLYRWFFRPHLHRNPLKVSGVSPVRESLVGTVERLSVTRRDAWLARMRALGREAR